MSNQKLNKQYLNLYINLNLLLFLTAKFTLFQIALPIPKVFIQHLKKLIQFPVLLCRQISMLVYLKDFKSHKNLQFLDSTIHYTQVGN